jgi:hypothetical protein
MNIQELIDEIVGEVSYRTGNGLVDFQNGEHLYILSEVLTEMGLGGVKDELIQVLMEADTKPKKKFKNPILNKVITYIGNDKKEKKGTVGALLRLKDDQPGREAADGYVKNLSAEERDGINKELGSQNQPGRNIDAEREKGGETDDGQKEEPQQNVKGTAAFSHAPDIQQKYGNVDDKSTPDNKTDDTSTDAESSGGKVKNKKLKQDVNARQVFNEGEFSEDSISDEEFEKNERVVKTNRQIEASDIDRFFVDETGNTAFPKEYLKTLQRLLNTKSGNGLSIVDFKAGAGAGILQSQTGELLTMMVLTIKDKDKADEFFKMIEEHVKGNGKDSIIDAGWVKSAKMARNTVFTRYDRMYGKGKWELGEAAWDNKSEVEALGLENYEENKGYSTDTYVRVKVNGEYILDEISLKKELKANLLTMTSGRVQDITIRGFASDEDLKRYDEILSRVLALKGVKDAKSNKERKELQAQLDEITKKYSVNIPDEAKLAYAQQQQRQIHDAFIKSESGEAEAQEFFKKFCDASSDDKNKIAKSIKSKMNQKDDYIKQVTQKLGEMCGKVKSGTPYSEALMTLEKSGYQKLNLAVMIAIAEENPESEAAKRYNEAVENSHKHSLAVRDFLLNNEGARKGLFASIREGFPLKALFEGEENMVLAELSADTQVLQDMFGVENFEELEQKLTIRDVPRPPSIVYRVKGKEDIPIAEIASRPDGIGYGGSWILEMKIHPEFGKKLRESNEKLNKAASV